MSQKKEENEVDIRYQFLNSERGKDFVKWWRNHRFSGYAPMGDRERWGIDPYTASRCSRYMAEYCSDRNLAGRGCFEYSAKDYEDWARDQKEAMEAIAIFATNHDGREVPTLDEFGQTIREFLSIMRGNFEARSAEAKKIPELKYWDKEAILPTTPMMTDDEVNARLSLLANQADAIKAKE